MEIGTVKPVAIEEEMQDSYLDYAMSVIVSRALPDVRDGLKPVHRRILVTLHDLNLTHTAHFRKSAKICGDVSGNYHPHGEAIVYPSMARLAQDFNMRYPLVDGQGNFGSIDGDNPAAMRYTEARMTALAEEMLADIDKDTVDWADNYDSTRKEPVVLPARIPNLLINGSAGIAVGMATNIPPHNLTEVCDAAIHIINRQSACVEAGIPFDVMWARAHVANVPPEVIERALQKPSPALRERLAAKAAELGHKGKGLDADTLIALTDDMVEIAPEELIEIVKGPDFPTGGLILGMDGIQSAYTTGRGRIIVRAKAFIEEARANRFQIVVTELPYQVNKASLLEKIAELVRDKRIDGIADLRDESDRQGLRIVIELKRDATPRQVLAQLYKRTALQTSFSANMLALVDNQPRTLSLKAMLQHYLDHRRNVVTRRTQYELDKARQRAHILEGLKIALDNLDEVINTIRRSRDAETARPTLMKRFGLTEIQAQAILDLQLRRLAALERRKILEELAEIKKRIAYLEDLLNTPLKILYVIRDELEEIKAKYGDPRRTRVCPDASADISEEDLIPDQEVVVALTARGYVRRLPVETYRPQRKARGAGTGAIITREDDAVIHLMIANTRDDMLFFTDHGRVYQMKVNDVPDAAQPRQSRGLPLANFVNLDPAESVTALVRVREYKQGDYLVMLTRLGEVKRIDITDFASVRSSGIIAMNLAEEDELRFARRTEGDDDIIIATNTGRCIRFSENAIRVSGRLAGGVRGIRLGENEEAVGLDVVDRGTDLLAVSERGFVKRTALDEFAPQGRGGSGVICAKVTAKTGNLVTVRVASEGDEVMVASQDGIVYRANVKRIPRLGRSTIGIGLVKISAKDRIVAMACLYSAGGQQPPEDGEPAKPRRARAAEAAVATKDGKAAGDGKKAGAKATVKVAPDGGKADAAPAKAKKVAGTAKTASAKKTAAAPEDTAKRSTARGRTRAK